MFVLDGSMSLYLRRSVNPIKGGTVTRLVTIHSDAQILLFSLSKGRSSKEQACWMTLLGGIKPGGMMTDN